MTASNDTAVTTFTAIDDPPEIAKLNPIHAEGATAYGYKGAIVAGLSSYGWAAAAIIELLGEAWLDLGWSEFRLPRPVFGGDPLTTSAIRTGAGTCSFEQRNHEGKATVVGTAGLGLAPFHDEWQLPTRREPVPPAGRTPLLLPAEAPVGEDYPPMAVAFTADAARQWSAGRLGDPQPRYVEGDHPRAHPSWVPGRMTPLIRHSYRFAAGIHTSGRVQHLGPLRAPQDVIVAGRWISSEERKGKWWSTSDAVFETPEGVELAYCQQSQILLPPLDR